jgi:hypothetical protein
LRRTQWLLTIVGILLVADGYWASRNLVLKSAEDGIYWFNTDPMLSIYVGKEFNPSQTILWDNDRWVYAGKEVRNLEPYWQHADNTDPGRSWKYILNYRLHPNDSILTARKSLEAAFRAGAQMAVIMTPSPEIEGEAQDSVPVFRPPRFPCEEDPNCRGLN